MDRTQVRHHMTHFLTHPSLTSLQECKKYLINLRNSPIKGFTPVQSRSLWFSLIFYKFRDENSVTDELYSAVRRFLLNTISMQSTDESYLNSAKKYLEIFEKWKKEDRQSFLDQIVSYYIDVLQLKQIIEETQNENTINEWKESYQNLLITIRESANRMGFLRELDKKVEEINQKKKSIVEELMKRAYWDMIEEDIKNKYYDTTIAQLIELKDLIRHIIPQRFHSDLNDKFDIDFIKQCLENNEIIINKEHLINVCRWILDSMKEWDSAVARPLYEREMETWENSIQNLEWPRFLRFSLELCTILALDAKTRISIWRSLL